VVKLALAMLLASAAIAHAETDDDDRAILGYHLAAGMVPLDHQATSTVQMGLGVEHQITPRMRLFGEYEWIWMFRNQSDAAREEHGDGQRAQVGIRRRFAWKSWHELTFFADGELGGGFMLANDNMTGVHAVPHGFIGARFGYDFHASRERKALSSTLTCELMVRAIAVPDGIGMAAGIGVAWH
jgi:hypothetical protein